MRKFFACLAVLLGACGSSSKPTAADVQSELPITFAGQTCTAASIASVRISYGQGDRAIVETHDCAADGVYTTGSLVAGQYTVLVQAGVCYSGTVDVDLTQPLTVTT